MYVLMDLPPHFSFSLCSDTTAVLGQMGKTPGFAAPNAIVKQLGRVQLLVQCTGAETLPIRVYNNYLCTYDLYGPVCNAFDAGSILYKGKWEGVGSWKSRVF